ncbi:MAG: DUF1330 domain-containing protein [Pseudomonadota bacterium]
MNNEKPAYMMVKLHIKDLDDYMARYVTPLAAMFESYGIEVLAASGETQVLEGEWDENWTVILKFPSLKTAQSWYNSEEYEPLKALRINELTSGGSAVFVEGFDAAALGL